MGALVQSTHTPTHSLPCDPPNLAILQLVHPQGSK